MVAFTDATSLFCLAISALTLNITEVHFAKYNLLATPSHQTEAKTTIKNALLDPGNPKNILYCQSANDFVHTRFTLALTLDFRDRIGGITNLIITRHTNLV